MPFDEVSNKLKHPINNKQNNAMNILKSLLNFELSITSSNNPKLQLFISLIFVLIFIYLTMNIENKTFVCIFAGLLLFWERFIIIYLKQHITVQTKQE